MPSATERTYVGDWLKEEFSQNFCREERVLLAGSGSTRSLTSGTIVAQVKTGVAAAPSSNTGDGVVTLGTIGPKAITGVYTLICISESANAGVFEVETPSGEQLQSNVVVGGGATNVDGHFTITIADDTDWDIDDTITVTISDGKIVAYDDTASDTKSIAVGVCYEDAEAAASVDGVVVILARGPAVITKDRLVFPSTASAAEKAAVYATLKELNIIAVEGV